MVNPEEIIRRLNPIVRGRRNYFSIGYSTKMFLQLDRYIYFRLKRMARAKQKRKNRSRVKSFDIWYKKSCIEKFHSKVKAYA